MPLVNGILFMNLHQLSTDVVNFLPESDGCFVGVNFLHITSPPSLSSAHVKPITPPTTGQVFPTTELPFILSATAHGEIPGVSLSENSKKHTRDPPPGESCGGPEAPRRGHEGACPSAVSSGFSWRERGHRAEGLDENRRVLRGGLVLEPCKIRCREDCRIMWLLFRNLPKTR